MNLKCTNAAPLGSRARREILYFYITGKIPRLRLRMTHSVISNECERSFFSSIFEGVIHELTLSGEDENGVRFDLCNSASPSFPHVFSGNPGGIRTGPPIKTFGGDGLARVYSTQL